MAKGKLIVMEGACDGIGKTTQFELLKERLIKEGYDVVTHHFPSYNKNSGKLAVAYLNGEYGNPKDLSPYFVAELYTVDIAAVYLSELKPALEEGKMVLLDRYSTSTLMYQASVIEDLKERKAFLEYEKDYIYNKVGIGIPDKVIFLNAPFSEAVKFRKERTNYEGNENDIHETNDEYLKGVYDNAQYVSNVLDMTNIDCYENNSMRSKEDIHEEIYQKIFKNDGYKNN